MSFFVFPENFEDLLLGFGVSPKIDNDINADVLLDEGVSGFKVDESDLFVILFVCGDAICVGKNDDGYYIFVNNIFSECKKFVEVYLNGRV